MNQSSEASRAPVGVLPLLCVWFAAALAVAASGALAHAPRPVVPLLLLAPVIAFALAARRRGDGLARRVLERLPLAAAIAVHVPRALVGAAFLVAAAHGRLPRAFALPAGYGDILAGLGALGALALLPTRPRLVRAWNLLALVDIVLVVASAQRFIVFGGADAARPFFAFPFPMLPTFLVPLVLISHGIVAWRLRRRS